MMTTLARGKAMTIIASGLLAYLIWLVSCRRRQCTRCEMSIMSPSYEDWSTSVDSSLAYKYRLFKYTDLTLGEESNKESCVPILFIPGSMGSYRQVRSIASTTLRVNAQNCFHFWAVDFRGEFVAFSADLLESQANFVKDSIRFITKNYHKGKMIILGHSFGGIIGRMIVDMEWPLNLFLVTVSSPHRRAPIVTCSKMTRLYKNLPKLTEQAIVISSSTSDILVPSSLSTCNVTHKYRVDQIGGNWANPNHQAMIWEAGLMKEIAKLLYSLAIDEKVAKSSDDVLKTIAKSTVKCQLIENPPSHFTRGQICKDHHQVCLVYQSHGRFEINTGDALEVLLGSDYGYTDGLLNIVGAESKRFVREIVAGKSRRFHTITGTHTTLTERSNYWYGEHVGKLFLRVDCSEALPLGKPKEYWDELVVDGLESYLKEKGDISTAVNLAPVTVKTQLSFLGTTYTSPYLMRIDPRLWIIGQLNKIQGATTVKLSIKHPPITPIEVFISSSVIIQGIKACNEQGQCSYSTETLNGHVILVGAETQLVSIKFRSPTNDFTIRASWSSLLSSYLISDADFLVVILSLASLMAAYKMSSILSIGLISISSLFSKQLAFFDLVAAVTLISIIVLMVHGILLPLGRRQRHSDPKTKTLLVLNFGILLCPLPDELRIVLLSGVRVFSELVLHKELNISTIVTISTFAGPIMEGSVRMRNWMVLIQDIGLSKVLQRELTINWSFTSCLLFICLHSKWNGNTKPRFLFTLLLAMIMFTPIETYKLPWMRAILMIASWNGWNARDKDIGGNIVI